MENFKAAAYAVTAGIILVIILYISYIAIPLILLSLVVGFTYFLKKQGNASVSPSGTIVRW